MKFIGVDLTKSSFLAAFLQEKSYQELLTND